MRESNFLCQAPPYENHVPRGQTRETLEERGLDFAGAAIVLTGRKITIDDDRRDYGEMRHVTYGRFGSALIAVVWTQRGDAKHIISMRKCNDAEKQFLREHLDRSG